MESNRDSSSEKPSKKERKLQKEKKSQLERKASSENRALNYVLAGAVLFSSAMAGVMGWDIAHTAKVETKQTIKKTRGVVLRKEFEPEHNERNFGPGGIRIMGHRVDSMHVPDQYKVWVKFKFNDGKYDGGWEQRVFVEKEQFDQFQEGSPVDVAIKVSEREKTMTDGSVSKDFRGLDVSGIELPKEN